jgi:ADP-heptose:LPS heptosyltransferase
LENFLEIAHRFETKPGIAFVLLAGPEYGFVTDLAGVRAQGNLVSLAGKLTLDETAALLTQCELVLTVDTGLMHMASALHRPMVVVSGWPKDADPDSHYSPARFGPWKADFTMISPPVDSPGPRPIDRVSIDEVFAALNTRMRAT